MGKEAGPQYGLKALMGKEGTPYDDDLVWHMYIQGGNDSPVSIDIDFSKYFDQHSDFTRTNIIDKVVDELNAYDPEEEFDELYADSVLARYGGSATYLLRVLKQSEKEFGNVASQMLQEYQTGLTPEMAQEVQDFLEFINENDSFHYVQRAFYEKDDEILLARDGDEYLYGQPKFTNVEHAFNGRREFEYIENFLDRTNNEIWDANGKITNYRE